MLLCCREEHVCWQWGQLEPLQVHRYSVKCRGFAEGGYGQKQPQRLPSGVEGSQLDLSKNTGEERH